MKNVRAIGYTPPTFTAATFNVGSRNTPHDKIVDRVRQLMGPGTKAGRVTIVLLQEVFDGDLMGRLRRATEAQGFRTGQNAILWNPQTWTRVHSEPVLLSDEVWHPAGRPDQDNVTRSPAVILADRAGRTLTALSYHLPPHVQNPNPPAARRSNLEDSMDTMARLAKKARSAACLFGGDDNVDEARETGGPWDFMLERETGMRLIRPPEATHGRRRIDDFRVADLHPVPKGAWTMGSPSDHRIHARVFRFTPRRPL